VGALVQPRASKKNKKKEAKSLPFHFLRLACEWSLGIKNEKPENQPPKSGNRREVVARKIGRC
jgi:hypothetical protein